MNCTIKAFKVSDLQILKDQSNKLFLFIVSRDKTKIKIISTGQIVYIDRSIYGELVKNNKILPDKLIGKDFVVVESALLDEILDSEYVLADSIPKIEKELNNLYISKQADLEYLSQLALDF
ncbi:MAG: hypothetical protein ACI4L6_03635 [Candidatus Onthoplasma sp.]